MKNETKYKWPVTESGAFTHTEFAQANGVKNQIVWPQWARARASGQLLHAGYRKAEGSKGKPSLLFRLNPDYVAPVEVVNVTPATPAEAIAAATPVETPADGTVAPAVAPVPVVAVVKPKALMVPHVPPVPPAPKTVKPPKPPKVPKVKVPKVPKEKKVAVPAEPVVTAATPTIVIAGLPVMAPAMPPVPVVNVAPVVDATPAVVSPVAKPVAVVSHTMEPRVITQKCPICDTPLQAMNDATGIMVWCGCPDREKCTTHESPSGHGRSEQAAYDILCGKFKK